MSKRDFLFEIGTEELPPKSLFTLAKALAEGVATGLDKASISHGNVEWFATPRRMAVRISSVSDHQPDQAIRRQGPAVANAFDASGQPSKAALGFAASCGVSVEALEQVEGPKGRVLQFSGTKPGATTLHLLPNIVTTALSDLPIGRRMRWGEGEQEFVRPVHWVVLLFGAHVVEAEILGVRAGKHTRGHRFHAPQPLAISSPSKYCDVLLQRGHVMADAAQRRERIRTDAAALAQSIGGTAVIDAALLDEVTALVEWPVALLGRFDERFLRLPQEVPIATMQDHQRYFPVRDASGSLMNVFITVSNIESREPDKVRDGNERVVRPRLADAAFFWDTDRSVRLDTRRDALRHVTFQAKLGSLYDKSERVAALASRIAEALGAEAALARRAAELSKCDLLSLMVGEFPELQGLMGRYYAQHDGEPAEVCAAIEEQYLPRFSGDRLPATQTGMALALADKLDTIVGIFSIGERPTGARDPFGLRRSALGIIRICVERAVDVDLYDLIEVRLQSAMAPTIEPRPETSGEVWTYLMERFRGHYLESGANRAVTTEMFDAVVAGKSRSPVDIDARLRALEAFLALPASASLAGANKRIANILRKAGAEVSTAIDTNRLVEPAERQLFDHVIAMERAVNPLFARRDYQAALTQLASLREDVDRFFEAVMVMVDDVALRANRLGLLRRLRELFLKVADLSQLPG